MDIFGKVLKRIKNQQVVLVIVLLLGSTAIVAGVLFQSYQSQSKLYRTEKLNYLNGIVKTVLPQIDGDRYEAFLHYSSKPRPGDSSYAYFFELRSLLNKVKAYNELSTEIYTLSKLDKGDSLLHLIVNSGDSIYFKNEYNAPETLIELYTSGGTLGPYRDKHGRWLSAFSPIYNSHGAVVGSLQADIGLLDFEKDLKAGISSKIEQVVLVYAIILLFLVLITRAKINAINRLQKTFVNLSNTVADKNLALNTANAQIENRNAELQNLNGRLEELVALRTEELRAKNEELQQFFYHASHKMKTPIVNILGLVELSRIEEAGNTHDWGNLEKIAKLAKRTTRLLDQLNKASYTNSGVEKGIILGPFIEQCIKNNPYKDCVQIHISCNKKPIMANPYLLQVVFDAIMENAIYFSRKHRGDDAVVAIDCKVDDCGLVTSITDNGPGIPPQFIQRICEMFFIGSHLSRGSGLGLYLAQQAVLKIGGELSFYSTEGHKTTVTLKIPHV